MMIKTIIKNLKNRMLKRNRLKKETNGSPEFEIPETLIQPPDMDMLNLKLTDWEDIMITDLAGKLKLSEDIILEITANILSNELQAKHNSKDCLLTVMERHFIKKYRKTE